MLLLEKVTLCERSGELNCSVHCSGANIGSKSSRCFEVALDALAKTSL